MLIKPLLSLLLCACWSLSAALDTLTSSPQISAIERSSRVHALVVLATDVQKEDEEPRTAQELATTAYPTLTQLESELDGLVSFSVVDVASRHKNGLVSKWQLQGVPALVLYKDPPKENPYTGKLYRDAVVLDTALLDHPRKLKRTLKQAVPTEFVQEVGELPAFQEFVDEHTKDDKSVALLVSKHKHPTPLYRALAAEFYQKGITFAFLSEEEDGAKELMQTLKVDTLPAMLVLKSMTEYVVLASENMKTYQELKGFVEPFAKEDAQTESDKKENASSIKFFTTKDFDELVLKSDVIWMVEFMDEEREKAVTEAEWKKAFTDVHRKAGMIAIGAVSCTREGELCERFGGPGVRIFPLELTEEKTIKRAEVLPKTYKTQEEAKEDAISSIPDLTVTVESKADLAAFISRSRESHALPIVLFTSKKSTPPMMKALLLSIPSQKIALAVIHDADPEVKKQFLASSSASTSLVCLVPTQPDPAEPAAAPFGIVAYEKKRMGSYTYPNVMQFMLQVLAQYPHPKEASPDSENPSLDESTAKSLVPYLTKRNLEELCSGNKICVIGFFEDHVDTLSDPESRLSKWMATFTNVAAQSKHNSQPFHFMWVNGKCQKAFAEAFEVGLYQMPTVAVYSPAKQRYATNVGQFDEENASAFLRSVLSGKIGTAPIGDVPQLGEECAFGDIQEVTMGAGGDVVEEDEDLDDLLSEIISDEKHQHEELEKELASDAKKTPSKKRRHKHKKSKKSKKSKSKN